MAFAVQIAKGIFDLVRDDLALVERRSRPRAAARSSLSPKFPATCVKAAASGCGLHCCYLRRARQGIEARAQSGWAPWSR